MLKNYALIFSSIVSIFASTAMGAPEELAQPSQESGVNRILVGDSLEEASLSSIIESIQPGSVVFLGELHGESIIRDQHILLLNQLRQKYPVGISVGMEFVDFVNQSDLDQFTSGQISESLFLERIKWAGFGFEFYREQILFPNANLGETTIGLNIPRTVTRQIARGGLASLTKEQSSLLPPSFTVGRDSYRQRFFEAMGMHPTPSLENYFVAQSAWDDTMAWQALQFKLKNPNQILVIVVGEFHVQYGGGLPDRFKARMLEAGVEFPIVTVSQVLTNDLTSEQIQQAIQPSPSEGPRADFIWLSEK